MRSYKVLMVEDSDAEAAALAAQVAAYAKAHGIQIALSRETTAFSLAERAHDFDLVFLDIDLPGLTGMEAAEALREHDAQTPLVFVTNLAQYAVHGYAVDALDFIVKPVSPGSVAMALDKALRMVDRNRGRSIVVQTREATAVVALRDLVSVEVRNHDLLYHLEGGEPLLAHGTLAGVERQLGDAPFVRISASCLANMEKIHRVQKDRLLMTDGSELWFSRGKKPAAMGRIAEYLGGTV